MKGKETKSSPSADLLVCFPSRAHLTLMPTKPICSPGRHSEPNSHNRNHNHRHHSLKKSSTTRACGYGSPQLWARTKSSMGSEIAEPTSPKVTCAGQIRVRPKNTGSRSWKSVMEEFVKIQNHNHKVEHKKGATWTRALGFKKEALQFLVCTRGMRFSLCCFGTFRETKVNTEVEEEEHEDEDNHGLDHGNKVVKEEEDRAIPPPNALLLMRCRSAPVRIFLENNEEQRREEEGKVVKEKSKESNQRKSLKSLMEENRKKENLLVISSSLIAKETWISRSVSWNK